jgi:hypothetical protein
MGKAAVHVPIIILLPGRKQVPPTQVQAATAQAAPVRMAALELL